MITRLRPRLSSRRAGGVAAALLLASLVSGCGEDEEAAGRASGSSSPASASASAGAQESDELTAEDYDEAVAEVEAVAAAGEEFLTAFGTFDQVLRTFVQQDPDTADVAAVQAAATPYNEASAAYRAAADSMIADPFVVDPEVSAARDAYRAQVLATLDSRDANVGVFYSYGLCDLTLEVNLLERPRHTELADACIETVEPLTSSAYPEVAAFGEAITTLMRKDKRAYADFDRARGGFVPPDATALEPGQLETAGAQLRGVGAAAERAGSRLVAAYDAFFPTLQALTGEGGSGGSLAAANEASSTDATQAALLEVLQQRAAG